MMFSTFLNVWLHRTVVFLTMWSF